MLVIFKSYMNTVDTYIYICICICICIYAHIYFFYFDYMNEGKNNWTKISGTSINCQCLELRFAMQCAETEAGTTWTILRDVKWGESSPTNRKLWTSWIDQRILVRNPHPERISPNHLKLQKLSHKSTDSTRSHDKPTLDLFIKQGGTSCTTSPTWETPTAATSGGGWNRQRIARLDDYAMVDLWTYYIASCVIRDTNGMFIMISPCDDREKTLTAFIDCRHIYIYNLFLGLNWPDRSIHKVLWVPSTNTSYHFIQENVGRFPSARLWHQAICPCQLSSRRGNRIWSPNHDIRIYLACYYQLNSNLGHVPQMWDKPVASRWNMCVGLRIMGGLIAYHVVNLARAFYSIDESSLDGSAFSMPDSLACQQRTHKASQDTKKDIYRYGHKHIYIYVCVWEYMYVIYKYI